MNFSLQKANMFWVTRNVKLTLTAKIFAKPAEIYTPSLTQSWVSLILNSTIKLYELSLGKALFPPWPSFLACSPPANPISNPGQVQWFPQDDWCTERKYQSISMANSAMGKERPFLTQGTQADETLVFDYSFHFNSELQVLQTCCEQTEETDGGGARGRAQEAARLSRPSSSCTLTTMNLLLQGMEIVQTMNSDPGLAVGMYPLPRFKLYSRKLTAFSADLF